jgi:arylsulfatase
MSRLFTLLTLIAASCIPAAPVRAAAPGDRPNILVILADDLGVSDIGCYGSEIATPNLDRLATNGLRFTQFYNTARCCPTRASLLTGLYAHQAGVGHMVQDKGHPSYQGYLNDRCVTVAEALKPAGYHPLMVGKWHVGEERGHWPVDRGFERFYGLASGGSNYWKLDKGRHFAIENEPADPTGEPGFFMTDAFSDQAVKYVGEYAPKAKDGEPFFLYLAYTAPHWPLHAHPQDIAKYKGKYMIGWDKLREQRRRRMIELGLIAKDTPLTPRDPKAPAWDSLSDVEKEAWDLNMAVYAAQIDRMDQGIGKVLDKLKETHCEQNTLVLFLADNGGCAEEISRSEVPGTPPGPKESFRSYGLPWANASNTPFRRYKHWVHEGGIASPLVAYWPGKIKANTLTAEPSHLIDLVPTFLELARAEHPKTNAKSGKPSLPPEGRSLVPLLTGATDKQPERAIYWEHEGNRAVRLGKWKLVALHNKPWELYDIDADRVEMNDLAEKHPERVQEMKQMYQAWAKRCDVMPWAQINRPVQNRQQNRPQAPAAKSE